MKRQQNNPYYVSHNPPRQLDSVTSDFDEDWLQEFIFTNHHAIPVHEIEPAFKPLIPICRELPTNAGPIDALFINDKGLLTMVECKLWKNPEARREVIGQILDYAKEISQWSYETLQKATHKGKDSSGLSLYELVSQNTEELDERDFVDNVSRNLRRGRFLLLILGDGIRENVEQIAEFLQKHAHLNFSFALVEFGVFRLHDQTDEYIVQPRVIAQTVEIERAVFRIEDNQIVTEAPVVENGTQRRKRTKISEQVFFENLDADAATKASLRAFLERVRDIGIDIEPGQNSIILKSLLHECNFGIFRTVGYFENSHIASRTESMGQPQIGADYLERLARLLNGGIVRTPTNRFRWTVRIKEGNRDRYVTIAEVLAVQDSWIEIMQNTLDQIAELGNE